MGDELRLADLEPEWVRHSEGDGVLTISNAQGIMFGCPICDRHSILAWFKDRGVPDDEEPGPGRWTPSGTDFGDLSLVPSINLNVKPDSPCKWHGFVTNGEVT